MQTVTTVIYYIMALLVAVAMIRNFLKTRNNEKAILYLLVLTPFVMRLFRLK